MGKLIFMGMTKSISYAVSILLYTLLYKGLRLLFKSFLRLFSPAQSAVKTKMLIQESYKLNFVVDGDTMSFVDENSTEFRVRLYGIDTPEKFDSAKLDKETKEGNTFLKKLMGKGVKKEDIIEAGLKASNVVKDIMNNGEYYKLDLKNVDKYGRYVAIVYVDGENFNEILVSEGIAIIAENFISKFEINHYKSLENYARTNKNGLWENYSQVLLNMK
jgi:micrococcal nuclease